MFASTNPVFFVMLSLVFLAIMFLLIYSKKEKSIPVVVTINPLDYRHPNIGNSEATLRKSLKKIVELNPDRIEIQWCPSVDLEDMDTAGVTARLFSMVINVAKGVLKW